MVFSDAVRRYRAWYWLLLHLYPRPYLERYGEGMLQTFTDLCRERQGQGSGLKRLVLWMFVETSAGIIKENVLTMILPTKSIVRVVIATALILLIPLVAMQFTDQVVWTLSDFVIIAIVLLGAGFSYEFLASRSEGILHHLAVASAVGVALFLVWVNLAVGVVGEVETWGRLMVFMVVIVEIVGTAIARFKPQGMVYTLVAAATAQMLVALIAQIGGLGNTYLINGFFAVLWLGSASLFYAVAQKRRIPQKA